MAKITLGMGTSHSPQLTLKPEQWELRRKADQHNPELWFSGKPYTFDQIVDVRADRHFERELGFDKFQARHAACQTALDELGETFARYSPDVAVIFGDDQHEAFLDDPDLSAEAIAAIRAGASAGWAWREGGSSRMIGVATWRT